MKPLAPVLIGSWFLAAGFALVAARQHTLKRRREAYEEGIVAAAELGARYGRSAYDQGEDCPEEPPKLRGFNPTLSRSMRADINEHDQWLAFLWGRRRGWQEAGRDGLGEDEWVRNGLTRLEEHANDDEGLAA